MLHVRAAIQKERGLLNSKSNSIKYWPQVLSLIRAIQKLSSVAISATGDTKRMAHLLMEGINYVTRLPRFQLWCLIFVNSFPFCQSHGSLVSLGLHLRQWKRQLWKGPSVILKDGYMQNPWPCSPSIQWKLVTELYDTSVGQGQKKHTITSSQEKDSSSMLLSLWRVKSCTRLHSRYVVLKRMGQGFVCSQKPGTHVPGAAWHVLQT